MQLSFLDKNLITSGGIEAMVQHCQCCMVACLRHANTSFLYELATDILRRWRKDATPSSGACRTKRNLKKIESFVKTRTIATGNLPGHK